MIADINHAVPIYRPEDNELMGLICQDMDEDDLWQPLTLFGYPLASYMSRNDASKYLQSHGLEALLDKWQFLDGSDQEWYNCVIVEAKPNQLVIKISDYGHPRVHQLETISGPTKQKIRRN